MFKDLIHVALAGTLLLTGTATANSADNLTQRRPRLGFVLAAWDDEFNANPRAWERSVERVFDVGIRDVTMVTYRFVDPATGKISARSAYGLESPPMDAVVQAVLKKGKQLGMRVSLNPLVEIDHPDGIGSQWRGDLRFAATRLDAFFANYRQYIRRMTQLVKETDGHRLYIGSELKSLVTDREARRHWSDLIRDTRQLLPARVKLSYAANFDNAGRVPFWTELDEIGIDAYYSLAKSSEAKGRANPQVSVIQQGWRAPFDKLRKLGEKHGKPIVFSEWGVVPFDLTTVHPWDWKPTSTKDPQEQFNAYQATLDATRSEGEWLAGITFWQWSMPGNEGSNYRISADSKIVQLISQYAQ